MVNHDHYGIKICIRREISDKIDRDLIKVQEDKIRDKAGAEGYMLDFIC